MTVILGDRALIKEFKPGYIMDMLCQDEILEVLAKMMTMVCPNKQQLEDCSFSQPVGSRRSMSFSNSMKDRYPSVL